MTDPLLNPKQAGQLLNVPASWVLQEARAGRIPHVRLGRYRRFDARALEDWWRARAQGPVRPISSPAEPNKAGPGGAGTPPTRDP